MSTWRSSGGGGDNLPRRLGASLDRVARAIGGGDSGAMTVVFRHWETCVGPGIAAHAEPLSLRGEVLVVGVNEPAWATQLRFVAPEILGRLEEVAGRRVAERIEVRIRPIRGR